MSLHVSEPPAQSCEFSAIRGKWIKQTWFCPQRAMISAGDGHVGTECLSGGVYEVSPYLAISDFSPHEADSGTTQAFFVESFIQKATGRHKETTS